MDPFYDPSILDTQIEVSMRNRNHSLPGVCFGPRKWLGKGVILESDSISMILPGPGSFFSTSSMRITA